MHAIRLAFLIILLVTVVKDGAVVKASWLVFMVLELVCLWLVVS